MPQGNLAVFIVRPGNSYDIALGLPYKQGGSVTLIHVDF